MRNCLMLQATFTKINWRHVPSVPVTDRHTPMIPALFCFQKSIKKSKFTKCTLTSLQLIPGLCKFYAICQWPYCQSWIFSGFQVSGQYVWCTNLALKIGKSVSTDNLNFTSWVFILRHSKKSVSFNLFILTRRPASADRTARHQFQATGQPVSWTQASDAMTSRLPRYEAKCVLRRCFQCGSVPLRSDIKGMELPPANILIPLKRQLTVLQLCRWEFLYNETLQQTFCPQLSKRRQI